MILQDVYNEIATRAALDSTVTSDRNRILTSVNNQLRRLFLSASLESEREAFSLATVVGQDTYRLSSRVLRALNFRETNSPAKLELMSRKDFEKEYPYPNTTDDPGLPNIYVPMRKVRVESQPTAASVLRVISTSVADTTNYYVVIKGYDSTGGLCTERVTLNGTTAVNSVYTYASILSISKDVTNGTVTVTSNDLAVTNITLLALEKQREFWEIKLYPIPDAIYTIPYSAQVLPWTLSLDEEAVPVPDEYMENFLASVTAEVLFLQGDSKATVWDAKAESLRAELKDMNFLGDDDDARFGFEELDYGGDFE